MGYRFTLEHANWLAHVLQSTGATPWIDEEDAKNAIEEFVRSLEGNFYPSPLHGPEFRYVLNSAFADLKDFPNRPLKALDAVRRYFSQVPWVALLLPSQENNHLCDEELLRRLVTIAPHERGVILQIKDFKADLSLEHVFPAFKVALAESTKWPGVIIWTNVGEDAVFLPVRKDQELEWLFENLSRMHFVPDLSALKRQYLSEISSFRQETPSLSLVHISDIHLGSTLANQKLPRIKALIRKTMSELESAGAILPVVTGDLMDNPNLENLQRVRDFLDFLSEISSVEPLVVLGNHDMREDGWLRSAPAWALDIPVNRMFWHDECQVGISCFNSARGGDLAKGKIGSAEFEDLGNLLDKQPEKAKGYTLLAALHHHPIPVTRPGWYQERWYEKLLGQHFFEETGILEDSEHFLEWCRLRKIRAILHGHKHIPRCDRRGDCLVIGCGSTIGKVKTRVDYETFISLNVVTINNGTKKINCRLLAERVPGGGLSSSETHELFFSS